MSPALVVVLLMLLLGVQPISTDLYLPALPTLQRQLGAGLAAAQATLSALIICFGLGQLVCGPLADRFGRRPVLLVGIALYTGASGFGAAAQSIEALIVWRGVQGAAMAAAVTCGRSILRDLYAPQDGARIMSFALGGLGVIGMASPVVGGFLVQTFDWHAALLVPALFGAGLFGLVAWRFEETVPACDPRALQAATLVRNWRAVLADPTFRAWTALLSLTYGGIFVLLAGSSFVLIGLHGVSRLAYGVILASNSVCYLAGTMLCRRLLRRHGLRGAVARGAALSLTGGVTMAGLGLAGVHSVWAIMGPCCVYAVGHGIHQPCGQAGAVGPFPDKAGTAASLSGFAMMAVAFAVGTGLGHSNLQVSALPLTLTMGVISVGVAGVAWTLVQRHGDPARRPGVASAGAA